MKIAIYSDQFYPELSGISDSVATLGSELARRGHAVHFFVPRYSKRDYEKVGVPDTDGALGERTLITRFPAFATKTPSGQGRTVVPTPWHWHAARAFGPDIIHTHLFSGAGIEALIASRKLHVPLVGTNHSAVKGYTQFYPPPREFVAHMMLKFLNWYYNHCEFVTAPSQSLLNEMREAGFTAPSRPLSNPIDVKTFRPLPNADTFRQRFGLSESTIIFASHLSAEKNIDVLIRALAIVKKGIPAVELALAGTGPSTDDLRRLAASQGVERAVKFLGFLEKPALAEAYNASKAFAIASTVETQSMVTMQAMASGIPVIAANARALPEYVSAANGFLVEPGNVRAFAEKMIYLLTHESARAALGENARKSAEAFSIKTIVDEWERIYHRVIEERKHKTEK
ncbi:MAG TPA: glycosyltransferase [Candidatus Paceibacterota bacterium]|nr:glycosyltransferase [Candidatus Paceibacterota bacterium]